MTIDKLIVNLSGHNYQDSKLIEIDHVEMLKHIIEEIGIAQVKCSKIKTIDGKKITIKELQLIGKYEVEKVTIGYTSNHKLKYKSFTIDEFYNLK